MFAWRAFAQEPGAGPGAYLTVPELARHGVEIAFTSRHGGTSSPPFGSLNLSYVSGDNPDVVRANRTRALRSVGGSLHSWTGSRQVHGSRAVHVGRSERGAGWDSPEGVIPDADALWTEDPDVTVVVLTADCVPIVLADPDRGRVGVAHAGWRGLVSGVTEATVDAMGGADGLRAFVGPSIGPCCYEVGPDVAAQARQRLGDVVREGEGKGGERLDLWAGALVALGRAGVREVWPAALCTRCEPDRFYSHRLGDRGRQGAFARLAS
jgi:purine-nucleoside/S-methyl-5'-thioadenosine phosphorylase / adenosine deaminase